MQQLLESQANAMPSTPIHLIYSSLCCVGPVVGAEIHDVVDLFEVVESMARCESWCYWCASYVGVDSVGTEPQFPQDQSFPRKISNPYICGQMTHSHRDSLNDSAVNLELLWVDGGPGPITDKAKGLPIIGVQRGFQTYLFFKYSIHLFYNIADIPKKRGMGYIFRMGP
ncbi:hypothetical protein BYT27DRAFT_6756656 [Phlegmacium glaucopus]|nr:hypothetical protein BYT27DRAFT_6756656 [Phlegmacium glaucopus]